jgi:hypothetical protein
MANASDVQAQAEVLIAESREAEEVPQESEMDRKGEVEVLAAENHEAEEEKEETEETEEPEMDRGGEVEMPAAEKGEAEEEPDEPEMEDEGVAVDDGDARVEAQQPIETTACVRERPPTRAELKRKRDVDVLIKKAEKLEREAKEAEDLAKRSAVAASELAERAKQAADRALRDNEFAAAARRAAVRGRHEVAKREMPAGREKPTSPYNYFTREMLHQAKPGSDRSLKRLGEMWAALSVEEKQKYKDAYNADMKEYTNWAQSAEGRAILDRRNEIVRAERADMAEMGSVQMSPEKRAKVEPVQTPVKHTRATRKEEAGSVVRQPS